ncbi:DNA helicase-2/ATP-dependent DNA helicase PcrA [Bradyrhizobium sp. S3.2.6]|uniref:DEAD/DEAH box helicase n=1 Tax=Bradyrhizobium sp. S3.2.6 TaxID=3156428 RepID=UPI003398FCDA
MEVGDFVELIARVLGERRRPNQEQRACIVDDGTSPLLIVAGPGSGKTTVLVLRALRHVVVDRIAPENIMITTFTRKAAKEIRTRLIEWGIPLLEAAAGDPRADTGLRDFLREVDINRFVTGTLDSICEEALSEARGPAERPPVVVEAFVANQILARRGEVYEAFRTMQSEFQDYLGKYSSSGDPPNTIGDMTRVVRTLVDRFVQDEVDARGYVARGPDLNARRAVAEIFRKYREYLQSTNQMDFPTLERVFLERIRGANPPGLVGSLRAMLVDEYQDTNPLQERIYLELAARSGSSLTVVGDDDQSLYRFRGATIELFRDFCTRAGQAIPNTTPRMLYLIQNYRSTPEIVAFFNSFVQNDPDFAGARIQPPKPRIVANRPSENVPVLGMFRDDAATLATDLADLLQAIFRGGGRPADAQLAEAIRAAPNGGDLGDAVFIAHTVNEYRRAFMGNPASERLPFRLRGELESRGMFCFNPRGRALKDIDEVQRMLGLSLEAIDPSDQANPNGRIVGAMLITNSAKGVMLSWRNAARAFFATNPRAAIQGGDSLRRVMQRWQERFSTGTREATEWPVLDILYSFLPWMPSFQDDPEHQVYLEAVSRAAAQAATFSPYRSLVLIAEPHRTRSIESTIRDILVPIADDLVEVDEDIMASVPRDRLNIMTIHQAKGLEYPLVIVDVASDFKTNHRTQRFRRFPDSPSSVTEMEDDLARCTPIGGLRTARTAIQRSFEDLIRLYYVAYSRPQSVLLLVGCLPCLRYNTTIKNVATFWPRDGDWAWRRPVRGNAPPMANNIPLTLI